MNLPRGPLSQAKRVRGRGQGEVMYMATVRLNSHSAPTHAVRSPPPGRSLGPLLEFAEGGGHGKPRGADGRKKAAKHAHDQREDHTQHKQVGSNLKCKGEVRESLPVHGAGS